MVREVKADCDLNDWVLHSPPPSTRRDATVEVR